MNKAAPGDLFLVSNKLFRSLKIVDKEEGMMKMDSAYKRYDVIITAKRPKGVVKKKT